MNAQDHTERHAVAHPEFAGAAGEESLHKLLAASRCLIEAVATGQGEQALLQLAVELAADLVGARYGAIGILDERDAYRHFIHTGIPPEQVHRIGPLPKGHGILRQIMEQRGATRINNLGASHLGVGTPAHHPRMETMLAVPIVGMGRPYGRLYLCNRRDGIPFSAHDELLVSHLAQQLTLALGHGLDATPERPDDEEGMQTVARMLDLSPSALLVVQEGVIMAANVHAMPVLGAHTLGQLIGRTMATLVHEASREALAQRLAEASRAVRLPPGEFRVRRLDGGDGWIEDACVRIRYLGRCAALMTIRDITVAKQARQQLATLHSLAERLNRAESADAVYAAGITALREAAEADRSAILLFDKSARMRFVAWEGLSDAYRAATDGHCPWSVTDADVAPIFISDPRMHDDLNGLLPVLETEGIASLAFIPIVHRRRLIGKFMLYFDAPQQFPPELARHLLSIAEHIGIGLSRQQAADRSRRINHQLEVRMRRRTRQLEEANRDLEAFSYSVSHDLRAPLRAMNGFATILLAEHAAELDETGHRYLERIVTASRHMERLIDDLLRLSRVNRLLVQPQPVDLSAQAREIAAKLADSDGQRQVQWSIEDGLRVDADPGLLRIMMENLLENAWKYTSRNPAAQITLRRTEKDGRPGFEIADNGAGFDMQYADKLFAPFQRLHTAAEFSGTGIGLAIVQRILRRHGGSISAEARLGEGASFRFSLWDEGQHEELVPTPDGLELHG